MFFTTDKSFILITLTLGNQPFLNDTSSRLVTSLITTSSKLVRFLITTPSRRRRKIGSRCIFSSGSHIRIHLLGIVLQDVSIEIHKWTLSQIHKWTLSHLHRDQLVFVDHSELLSHTSLSPITFFSFQPSLTNLHFLDHWRVDCKYGSSLTHLASEFSISRLGVPFVTKEVAGWKGIDFDSFSPSISILFRYLNFDISISLEVVDDLTSTFISRNNPLFFSLNNPLTPDSNLPPGEDSTPLKHPTPTSILSTAASSRMRVWVLGKEPYSKITLKWGSSRN